MLISKYSILDFSLPDMAAWKLIHLEEFASTFGVVFVPLKGDFVPNILAGDFNLLNELFLN